MNLNFKQSLSHIYGAEYAVSNTICSDCAVIGTVPFYLCNDRLEKPAVRVILGFAL